jgi:hypothetical protein
VNARIENLLALHNEAVKSPHHRITASPHHRITASPHHRITASPHHRITASPHHRITASPRIGAGEQPSLRHCVGDIVGERPVQPRRPEMADRQPAVKAAVPCCGR